MTILQLGGVATLFVLGFTLQYTRYYICTKRTLELLVEASDVRLEKGKKKRY